MSPRCPPMSQDIQDTDDRAERLGNDWFWYRRRAVILAAWASFTKAQTRRIALTRPSWWS